MRKKAIQMRLQTQMTNLIKMRMINVRKHSKHLFTDTPALLQKLLRKATLFADPRGRVGRVVDRGWDGGHAGPGDSVGGADGKEGFIV